MAALYPDRTPGTRGTGSIATVGTAGQNLLVLGIIVVGVVILWSAVRRALFGKKKK
jgi:hypothetical protein